MKNLNIKTAFIALLFISFLSSCVKNDGDYFKVQGLPDVVNLKGTLSSDETIISNNASFQFEVTLPQTFDHDALVSVVGDLAGIDQLKTTLVIPAGEVTGAGSLTVELSPIVFTGQIMNVKIVGLKLLPATEDEVVKDNYVMTSDPYEVTIFEDYTPGEAKFLFGWDDASDLDILIYDSNSLPITDAQTGANPETFSMSDDLPDGEYIINVVYYATASTSMNYYFNYRQSDGSIYLVNGSLDGYEEDPSTEIPTFKIIKSGSNYTVEKL